MSGAGSSGVVQTVCGGGAAPRRRGFRPKLAALFWVALEDYMRKQLFINLLRVRKFLEKSVDECGLLPMLCLASSEAADAPDQSKRFGGRLFHPLRGMGKQALEPVVFES